MKKVLSSLILFFTLTMQISCSSLYPSVDVVPTTDWWKDYTPSVEVFQINDVCPNICWLGIHPGTTSIENAAGILMESNQIDQQSIQASETEVEAIWYPDQEKKAQTTVILYLDRGFVTSIRYYNLMPFTVEKFVNILGEPGEIRIELLVSPHDWFDLVYSIYFPVGYYPVDGMFIRREAETNR